jgi:hypothetical protein
MITADKKRGIHRVPGSSAVVREVGKKVSAK